MTDASSYFIRCGMCERMRMVHGETGPTFPLAAYMEGDVLGCDHPNEAAEIWSDTEWKAMP